jgi:lipoic acid synthetase
MILGKTCTRRCRFCSVATGNPHGRVDQTEPERVAQAAAELGLAYVVLTSVDRDDLPDLGAGAFAKTIRQVKSPIANRQSSIPLVEVLTPDFGGREELVRLVAEVGPDVFGHNLETVERLTPKVRDRRASYRLSLSVLATVKRLAPDMRTKSGLMVGLGETGDEIRQALRDLRSVGCDIVTVGQYLQPDRECLPVERYLTPSEFETLEAEARAMGFANVFSGPLVRSSFHAEEVLQCSSVPVVK